MSQSDAGSCDLRPTHVLASSLTSFVQRYEFLPSQAAPETSYKSDYIRICQFIFFMSLTIEFAHQTIIDVRRFFVRSNLATDHLTAVLSVQTTPRK